MRKSLLLSACLCAFSITMQAQELLGAMTTTNEVKVNKTDSVNLRPTAGGIDIGWRHVEDGFMLGGRLNFKYFFLYAGGSSASVGSGSSSVTSDGWHCGAGLRYRYYPIDRLWLEGAAGIGYYHTKVEVGSGKNAYKSSDGQCGVMIEPRIGYSFGKAASWGFYVGYRWDAADFKFDHAGGFSAGLALSF